MTAARLGHRATLIDSAPNGSLAGWVLITGGADSGPTAELFDPGTNRFGGTAAMHGTEMQVRRSQHQATWLPGINLVLITGGTDPGSQVLKACEIYNPGGGFLRIHDMNLPRVSHSATNIGLNVVLIAGGLSAPQLDTGSAELWDATGQAFTVVSHAMTRRRSHHSATLLTSGPHAGDVLLAGGLPTAADADLFHPQDQTFMAAFPRGTFGPYDNTADLLTPGQAVQCS
jgi:hypothetical protein